MGQFIFSLKKNTNTHCHTGVCTSEMPCPCGAASRRDTVDVESAFSEAFPFETWMDLRTA